MTRHDVLTIAMRRTYGGLFALLVDCTDPDELQWLRTLLQARPWIHFPGTAIPVEHFWDHRYRLHAALTLQGADWEKQRQALEVFWMVLDQAGERGWQPVGAEVRGHDLGIGDEKDRDITYRVPFVYHFRRERDARPVRPPPPSS